MQSVMVTRDRALAGCAVRYQVLLDGRRVGRMWFGRTLAIDADPGVHQIRFLSGSVVICAAVVHAGRAYRLTRRRPILRRLPMDILCGIRPDLVQL